MPIDPIHRFRATPPAPGSGASPPSSSSSGSPRSTERPASDAIEISSQAREQLEIQEAVAVIRQAAGQGPELHPARVEEIRGRIQQGYYERADVRGSIVDALLRSFQQDSEA